MNPMTQSKRPKRLSRTCRLCHPPKAFQRHYNLVVHKKTVHADRIEKIVCPICKKLISTPTNMRVHYRRFHSEIKKLTKTAIDQFDTISVDAADLMHGRFYGSALTTLTLKNVAYDEFDSSDDKNTIAETKAKLAWARQRSRLGFRQPIQLQSSSDESDIAEDGSLLPFNPRITSTPMPPMRSGMSSPSSDISHANALEVDDSELRFNDLLSESSSPDSFSVEPSALVQSDDGSNVSPLESPTDYEDGDDFDTNYSPAVEGDGQVLVQVFTEPLRNTIWRRWNDTNDTVARAGIVDYSDLMDPLPGNVDHYLAAIRRRFDQ